PVCSIVSVTRKPGHRTAFARSVCLSRGTEKFTDSKNCGSGQKRTVVPVLLLPTSPTTRSFEATFPFLKPMWYCLPPRLIQHSSLFDRAFTTDTPTPCKPPENL